MDKNELRKRLKTVFEENGIFIPIEDEYTALDLDSLQMISLIVCIENKFDIIFPEDYISNAVLSTFRDYYEILETIIQ